VPADVAARLEVPWDPEADRMDGGPGEPRVFTAAEVEEGFARPLHQDLSATRNFKIAARAWPDGRPVAEPAGRYIGGVRLHSISWADRRARLAIGIFDRRFWSRGYGTEAIRLLLRHGFDDLGLHRVDLIVLEFNARAIRCYEKCGFVREGVLRDNAYIAGAWHADLLMAVLEHEFRALPRATPPAAQPPG
jgi:RimJ/RimL family protein N-acetyltransferase